MNIVLNGENCAVDNGATIEKLLIEQELHGRRLAVEVNEMIIPKSRHATHVLTEEDNLTALGSIIGAIYGFIDMFIAVCIFALIYNKLI